MAEKMPNEIVIPSCSKCEIIDMELNTRKKEKRSISEDEDEYNDHTTETFTNNRMFCCKDDQSNFVCTRTSKQSLSDVIQQLTQQIEHIEKVASQNVIKKIKKNDVNYDDEFMYQPPNKLIKYDTETSEDSCNLNENSIGFIKKINTTKHANKMIKLDNNISFQQDNDFERDTKSISNDEVKMLELSYNFDDEDNTHIKVQTIEDVSLNNQIENSLIELSNNENEIQLEIRLNKSNYYDEESIEEVIKQTIEDIMISLNSSNSCCLDLPKDSKNIPPQVAKLNMPILLNETILDNKKNCISTEDDRNFQTDDQFKSNMFYFGTENCRDVSFYTVHSLDDNEMDNCLKSNTSIHSIETNASFVSLSNQIENSLVELSNNGNEIQLGIRSNKSDYYDEESIEEEFEQIIEDIMVSLNSSNSCCLDLPNSEECEEFFNNEIEINNSKVLQIYEDDFDFSNPIKQDHFIDLTKCLSDEIILDDDYINEEIKCKRSFDNINSETKTGNKEITHFSVDQKIDFEETIIQKEKLNEVIKNVDSQTNRCKSNSKTLNNQEKYNFGPSNMIDVLIDVNSQDGSQSKINDDEYYNKYVNDKIMVEDEEHCSSKINVEKRNINIFKGSIHDEEETLSKLNNKKYEFEVDKNYVDKITVSQICDDYFYENVSKTFLNANDFLELTRHVYSENTSLVNEGQRSDQVDKFNISTNYENNETIFINKDIDERCERSLSLNSTDAKKILEISKNDSKHSDDSLLLMPSSRDLVKYGIECEFHEKSISPCLKFNEVSRNNNTLISSSSAKDYEDNVKYFYDCDISSIENSDEEDNILLSFEKDTSIDNCIFVKSQDKSNATISTNNEQTCDNDSKIKDLGSSIGSCNNLSNVEKTPAVSFIHSPGHNHDQYNKILNISMSKRQISHDKSEVFIFKNDVQYCAMNANADSELKMLKDSNVNITASITKPSLDDSAAINMIKSDNLCIDHGSFNKEQNLEDSNKNHNQNNENNSIFVYNTRQAIKKSQKSFKNNESETIIKFNSEEITKTNIVQSSYSDINQNSLISEIDNKKKFLEEIIKNEDLLNKFDEKLDMNESVISPYISQSLVKSTNSQNALAKRAAASININAMSEKALCIYLTQQTMTLDVLKILHKSLDTCPSSGILMEDPEGLTVSLMPHQKHAIAWLIWRERQEPHGGILADDMGLGKTLTMISLILKEKQLGSLLPTVSIDNRSNDVLIGGTLIVCPASLLSQWENEFMTKLKPELLKVGQYYGINRNIAAIELAKNDVVMTSYNLIMWDYKKQKSSSLFQIKWRRIILDEAHQIRNKKTQTSLAVCSMMSIYRWAITGTPIHNKEADFYTLLKFIRCHPFDDWLIWKRWVGNNDNAGKHRLSLLVKTLMLRRTKQELSKYTTFKIPNKIVHEIEIELSKEERNAYEKLLQFSSNFFATYLYDRVAKEKLLDSSTKVQCKVQNFQEQSQDKDQIIKDHPELLELFRKFKNIEEIQTYHILVLLLRLRQICCHPALINGPITEESIKKDVENIPENFNEDSECNLTNSDSYYNESTKIVNCPKIIELSRLMSCLTLNEEPAKKNLELYNDSNIFQKSWISTKIKKVCDLVNDKVLLNGNDDKAIIISQWPSFLYLIHKHLAQYNAKIEMFSGTIPILKRTKIIREFNNPNGGPQILLLSLKAGGVGLNLMAANHLFLMDVHWNPQMEAQASDRVYRVGQKKTVNIYKFVCNNTIETRILDIQSHKLKIAQNLFEGTSDISSKITLDDLKQIFQFQ
ncbi:MATH and LRR domain-containing protein PFE0570w-like [Melanaphis sacchari]|uniref:MATH and LRR domain-containing protein PFE0570w-like n=1 Tax=Melanaphis sacchari TaxID=742174 RepID=UPI000DC14101|nr:MATH and LRR domain-containing protein PFE0570w-like [Melanaphis sacchari]